MELRNYQQKLINDARNSFLTNKRVLCVAPPGAGKTITFAYMCSEHIKKNTNNYVWFLVHRQELIDQTIETFKENNINLDRVLIGMVQTISRHLDSCHAPTLIVFDEAHHSMANQWRKIIDKYNNVPIVGLTGTACRLDGKPLGDIYTSLVNSVSVDWLINHNFLSPFKYYAPKINVESAEYRIKGSDFDQVYVGEKFEKQAIWGDVIKYVDISRKTIIYSPTIKFSNMIVERINAEFGSIARHFDANTPKNERKQIIEDFRNGKIRILSNVDLIGEGFNVPDCDSVFLLRPTLSTALYIQQSMRCMRYLPNKVALIYDFVGNCHRHGLPNDKHEWTLTKKLKIKNRSGEKDIITRMCQSCYRVYSGNNRVCPYCGYTQPKNEHELKEEHDRELEEIKKMEKINKRREQGMCRDYQSLVALARKRGYNNPEWFARTIMEARRKKLKSW